MEMVKPKGVVRLRIPEILAELRWTQKRLAETAGLSENAVVNLMKGPRAITFDTLAALSEATGKPVGELLEYREA